MATYRPKTGSELVSIIKDISKKYKYRENSKIVSYGIKDILLENLKVQEFLI